jgi:protocatechuate 3,4-dioxygenase beta subunit
MRVGRVAAAVLVALAAFRAVADDDADARKPKPPLTRIVKVVREEDNAPFAGVDVQAYGLPGGTVTKRTGDDGVVKFEKVPRKGVTFVARHDGRCCAWHEPGRWWWHTPEEDDDPDGDGVTTMTFAMEKGAVCEGRVVGADDGSPVAGAVVEAREDDGGVTDVWYLDAAPIWTATTGADGRFRTDCDRPRAEHEASRPPYVLLAARAPGWISETTKRSRTANEFRLRRAATLRGVVTNADGTPAAGVKVHAYPSDFGAFSASRDDSRFDENEHPRVQHVRTDANGRYEMAELPPGAKFFVYAERTVHPPDREFVEEPVALSEVTPDVGAAKAGDASVCDLKLRALSSLVVVVAPDAGGDAKETAFILDKPPRTPPWDRDEESPGGRTWKELLPGKYVLHVDADGWTPHTQTVEIPEGERVQVTVRLDRGAGVEGVVVDDRGAPVSGIGVYVRAAGARRESRSSTTDAAGAFRVTGVSAGPVELQAADADHIPGEFVPATAPATGLRLVAVRVPRISLRVDAPAGAALPAEVWAWIIGGSGRLAGFRDLRRVRREDLPAILDYVRPGPTDVVVDVPGFAPSTIHVDLKPGETTTVGPFAFEDGVALTGTVVDGAGRAVLGAKVTPFENDARTATTDARGAFVLPHLARGTAELSVVDEGFPETLLVAPTDAPLSVVLRPGGLVRGTVRAASGERVENRRLCIFDASAPNGFGPHWHASVDKEQKFAIRLPAGTYRFVPSRYEFGEGAVLFEAIEGGETKVDFVLPW